MTLGHREDAEGSTLKRYCSATYWSNYPGLTSETERQAERVTPYPSKGNAWLRSFHPFSCYLSYLYCSAALAFSFGRNNPPSPGFRLPPPRILIRRRLPRAQCLRPWGTAPTVIPC